MRTGPARRRRRIGVTMAIGALVALGASGAAHAAPGFFLAASEGGSTSPQPTMAQVYSTNAAEVPGPMRLRIERGGRQIESRIGDGPITFPSSPGASSTVRSAFALQAGDRVEWYVPSSSTVAARVIIWDAGPTVDTCPLGNMSFGGRADPVWSVRAYLNRAPGGPYGSGSPMLYMTRTGALWTATVPSFRERLHRGDVIRVEGSSQPDPQTQLIAYREVPAGTCAPGPRRGLLVFDGDDGALGKLRVRDVRQKKSTVTVRVRCLAASRIPCRGRSTLATAKKVKVGRKRRRLTLGSKAISLAPGKSRTLKVKVSRTGRTLLARRKLKSRMTAVTRDPAGDSLTRSRALTLKKRR